STARSAITPDRRIHEYKTTLLHPATTVWSLRPALGRRQVHGYPKFVEPTAPRRAKGRSLMRPPDRSELPEAEREIYDHIVARFSAHDPDRERFPASEVYAGMLQSPTVAQAIMGIGAAIRQSPEPVPRELHQWA